ncbi:MAG: hypothetical protein VR64_11875 [Desulfatitalea sp. BRH_c12]|nr:MAG: hypothetical protein VR64_11875 [Desulfatitalea sp. BRH_c12]
MTMSVPKDAVAAPIPLAARDRRRAWPWLMGLLALLPGLMFSGNAVADRSIRCQGRIVSIGAFIDQVQNKCGDPDHIERWEEGHRSAISQLFDYETERYLAPKLIIGPIRMERWTYNPGSTQFIRYLFFQNGKLIRIETGEKGSD